MQTIISDFTRPPAVNDDIATFESAMGTKACTMEIFYALQN